MTGYAKKIEKIIRESASDKKKKKPRLKFNPRLALTAVRTTGPRHSGRNDMSACNEDKNPSPVENQFYDFKDKQPKL